MVEVAVKLLNSSPFDYHKALQLYDEHCPDALDIWVTLLRVRNSTNEAKLKQLLSDWVAKEPPQKAATQAQIDWAFAPDQIRELHGKAVQAYRRRDALFYKLDSFDQPDREQACLEILDLGDLIADCFRQIDFFKKFGQLPPQKITSNYSHFTKAELIVKKQNLQSYIRANKHKASRADDVSKWDAQVKEIKNILKTNAFQS